MAITLTTPSPLALSGAPYILSGTTTCHTMPNSTMHRIVLTVHFYDTIPLSPTIVPQEYMSRDFIYCIAQTQSQEAQFSFNLRDTLHPAVRNLRKIEYDADGCPTTVNSILYISFTLREEYVINGVVQHPSTDINYPSSPVATKPMIIEGTLSDYMRHIHPEWYDLLQETFRTNKFVLTNRPKTGGVGLKGQMLHLYYFSSNQYGGGVTPPFAGLYLDRDTGVSTFVAESLPTNARRMLFLNRFGVVEDAVAFAEVSKRIGTKGNILESMRANTFTGQRTLYSRATPGDTEIDLSSGPVNEEWAEWWVTDVLRSERAWLYDEKRNYWMEGVIVPAEKHTIIDRSKSQASVIPFTFRCTMQS